MNKPVPGSPQFRSQWFGIRSASAGLLAFMLHRLTGFGLVFYLFLHLAALNLLRSGPQSWDRFIALMRSPLFIALDGVLLFGVLFHGLNGLRLTFLGFSRALSWQKPIFWTILSLSLLFALAGSLLLWWM